MPPWGHEEASWRCPVERCNPWARSAKFCRQTRRVRRKSRYGARASCTLSPPSSPRQKEWERPSPSEGGALGPEKRTNLEMKVWEEINWEADLDGEMRVLLRVLLLRVLLLHVLLRVDAQAFFWVIVSLSFSIWGIKEESKIDMDRELERWRWCGSRRWRDSVRPLTFTKSSRPRFLSPS